MINRTVEAAEIAKLAEATTVERCFWCTSEEHRMARSIVHRIGHDPSFKELWARLERAEADRDRMMNALQLALSKAGNGKVKFDPHTYSLLHRALKRMQPARAILSEKGEQA